MMIALVPFAVAVVGVLVYAFTDNKLAEVGRILFFCGALVTVLLLSGHRITVP